MEELEKKIIDVLNGSSISLEAKMYVMKHIYILTEGERNRLLLQQAQAPRPESEVKPDE